MTGHPIAERGQRTPAPEGHVHSGRRNAFGQADCLRGPGNRPPREDQEARGPASAVTGGRCRRMDEDLISPLVLAVVHGSVRNVDALVDDHERILSARRPERARATRERRVLDALVDAPGDGDCPHGGQTAVRDGHVMAVMARGTFSALEIGRLMTDQARPLLRRRPPIPVLHAHIVTDTQGRPVIAIPQGFHEFSVENRQIRPAGKAENRLCRHCRDAWLRPIVTGVLHL